MYLQNKIDAIWKVHTCELGIMIGKVTFSVDSFCSIEIICIPVAMI